jgi:hypothetical protein
MTITIMGTDETIQVSLLNEETIIYINGAKCTMNINETGLSQYAKECIEDELFDIIDSLVLENEGYVIDID